MHAPAGVDALAERVLGRLRAEVRLPSCPEERERAVRALVRIEAPLLDRTGVAAVTGRVLASMVGLGPLEALLADREVTEVMVNGPGAVWVERAGRVERSHVELCRSEIEAIIERVVGPLGRRVDRASPFVDGRLPDGSRINAVVEPLAVDGPCLTVRRFGTRAVGLDAMAGPGAAALLRWAVRARCNLVVSGGTGAGKTTLLNALAAELSPGERLVTVEDVAELRLRHDHVVRLEARPGNTDGAGEVPIRDLVRNALRMRPDRIVVGEVRGAEAVDMLQAMNTGHEGSLSTCHANSPADALRRLETMVLQAGLGLPLGAVREQLASAVDLIAQVARRADGGRGVIEVVEVARGALQGRVGVRPLVVDRRLLALPRRRARHASVAPLESTWLEPDPTDEHHAHQGVRNVE